MKGIDEDTYASFSFFFHMFMSMKVGKTMKKSFC